MAEINLIPSGRTVKRSTVKLLANLKVINFILTFIFVGSFLTIAGLLFTNSVKLKTLQANIEKKKNLIISLGKVEQQYVFLENRLALSKKILNKSDSNIDIENIFPILTSLPQGISLAQLSLLIDEVFEASFDANNYLDLKKFLASMSLAKQFKKIVISPLTFDPRKGYLFTLKISH